MRTASGAVGRCTTAFFLLVLVFPFAAGAQSSETTALDQLVDQAFDQIQGRYLRPLGSVAERRRDRVFVLLRQTPPAAGTLLDVVRPAPEEPAGERVVARLEVLQTEAGITECRQRERVRRAQAERGDEVRMPAGSRRLLLAPCISLVDLASAIPEVIGEKLRGRLLTSPAMRLVDDTALARRAEAAYLSSAKSDLMERQHDVDDILYPVLLQTPEKLILNLEYFSLERGRTTDIDVATVVFDDLLRAWIRAGRTRSASPPGFKQLPAQLYSWRVLGLAEASSGNLLVIDPDSARVFDFYYPGLRQRSAVSLGPRSRRRREPAYSIVNGRQLESGRMSLTVNLHVLSEERRPLTLQWSPGRPELPLTARPAAADLEEELERLGSLGRPPTSKREARWWPAPGQARILWGPVFTDVDADGRTDVVWTSQEGLLNVRVASQRTVRSFAGFGDVKALCPATAKVPAILWLTDPVWHGAPDRLHAAHLQGENLELYWSSDAFEGTLLALATVDLNADGRVDLVTAESHAQGTRLHLYLALPGEPASESGRSMR